MQKTPVARLTASLQQTAIRLTILTTLKAKTVDILKARKYPQNAESKPRAAGGDYGMVNGLRIV